MTETKVNPITELTINGEEYEAKGSFMFDKKAKEFATDTKDEKGNDVKTPGFNVIYNGILERDADALANFWECALAYKGKRAPKRQEIEEALQEVIEENEDTLELLQGALDVMNNSGFFKQKSRLFWSQMNIAPTMAKEDEKETTIAGIDFMKNNYKEIMGQLPY